MTDIKKIDNTAEDLYNQIAHILQEARLKVYKAVNTTMVIAYWNVGRLIVEAQGGEDRATYGNDLINRISKRLSKEIGSGFTATNLRYMRMFYIAFPNCHSLSDKLSWTHYRVLTKVSNPKAREYYAEEAAKAPWSVRQLERQIATQYYERLLSSHRDEEKVKDLIHKNLPAKPDLFDPLKLVHDPFVLEFLGVKDDGSLQESELEDAIITHLERFLLELGRGFAFMGRQKRLTIGTRHYYPDLVFYNVITKNYVIIDLKMNEADYADIGQMQLYVNYYNMEVCTEGDNPTIGIILCSEKNDALVRYTLGDRTDIGVFAPKYKLYLPSEEELKREIEMTRENYKRMKELE